MQQWIILALLVLQNSSHSLLIRYSRRPDIAGTVPYSAATTVFLAEVVKTATCFAILAAWDYRGNVKNHVQQLLKVSYLVIPIAFIYTLQNNLVFLALRFLDAATFHVMSQSKILTTALFTVFLLGRRLPFIKWISLFMLVNGLVCVELPAHGSSHEHASNKLVGTAIVCIVALLSGFAGVYFEKILKSTQKVSVFARSLQLSVWGMVFSVVGLVQDFDQIWERGFFSGYTMWTWVIILWSTAGGVLVALTIKFTDNIVKGFATSIAIVLSCCISAVFMDFQVTRIFVFGALLTFFATVLYSVPLADPTVTPVLAKKCSDAEEVLSSSSSEGEEGESPTLQVTNEVPDDV